MPEHDPAALRNWQSRMGPAGLRRVIQVLVADAPRVLGKLRDGVAQGDTAVVQRAAHSLKAPCGMFGAAELVRLCQELEDQAAAGALHEAPARVETITGRLERLTQELQATPPGAAA